MRVNFHFKVRADVAKYAGTQATGGVNAQLRVRPARGAGSFATASGNLSFIGAGSFTGTGLFAAHPIGGSFEVVLPVDLSPQSLSPDSLEFRLEGSATADAFANRSSCATGDLTVQFCANDPASITLTGGTPLASLGVRYALWPTVSPAPDCVEVPLG